MSIQEHSAPSRPHSRRADENELSKHAQLAIRVVDYLEEKFEPSPGMWRGDTPVKNLAYTCQAVEALSALDIAPVTDHMTQPALVWLTNLELGNGMTEDEQRQAHLFPSRFKTLAGIGRFESVRLRKEFESLSDLLDVDHGTMVNVPTEIRTELVTMIWLDTLLHLEQNAEDLSRWQPRREAASAWLTNALDDWLHRETSKTSKTFKRKSGHGELKPTVCLGNWGDASYALDLLLQSGLLQPDAQDAQEMARHLVTVIHKRPAGDLRESDPIYCAIQLSRHFRQDPAVQEAVLDLINEIAEGYHPQTSKQPIAFHALVLRLLTCYYGYTLKDQIVRSHWQERRGAQVQKQRDDESRLNEELARLLQTTFMIRVGPRHHISGSPARNEVFRVQFGFVTAATNEDGHPITHSPQALSVIIKRGTFSSLQHAIERYNALPPEIQRHFAHHAASLPPSSNNPDQLWFLLMQDLAQMAPLAEIVQNLDVPHGVEQEKLERTARAVGLAFRGLHQDYQLAQGATNQLDRLYILPMTEALDRLCESRNFPALKPFIDEGFVANDRHYKRLTAYLGQLRACEAKYLRPPVLTRVHGDAHSRNIMLPPDLGHAKFVDVESLTDHQDYLADYALLIEDIAFYRLLPCNDTRQRIKSQDLTSTVAGAESNENRNAVRYPAFPHDSETALQLQQELMNQISGFAKEIGDTYWQERLWLAVARALVQLLIRQTNGGRLRTVNSHEALDMVLVAYAEAIRLIDALIARLEYGDDRPLPRIPFPGEHTQPSGGDDRKLVQQVLALFKKLADVRRASVPEAPAWIRFYVHNSTVPFAEFRTSDRRGALRLTLFVPRAKLNDPEHLISERSEDRKGWVVNKAQLNDTAALDALIQSTYRAALARDS